MFIVHPCHPLSHLREEQPVELRVGHQLAQRRRRHLQHRGRLLGDHAGGTRHARERGDLAEEITGIVHLQHLLGAVLLLVAGERPAIDQEVGRVAGPPSV
jgi:hypothetical protein